MIFRTEVIPPANPGFISYETDMLAVGSCFADELGQRLVQLRFRMSVNPFGVIFNPVSMAGLLRQSSASVLKDDLFVERGGNWYHHGYHSKITATSKSALTDHINQIQAGFHAKLANTDLLILTFGTAWVYRHHKTNEVVANCHKIPQDQFSKELLDLDQLKQEYVALFDELIQLNPKLSIMLTVSPVRHIKDGVVENNQSKSILHLLTHFLVSRFEQVNYFPAYELVIDDLRDYRFFKEDLIHPNHQAIDYVFEKFSESYFSEKTKKGVAIKQAILKLQAHQSANTTDIVRLHKIQELDREFLKLNQP